MNVDDSFLRGNRRPEARVMRAGEAYQGKQGLTYLEGLTRATAGTRGICMTVVTLPPGARAKTHLHRGIETAVYVIEGEVEMLWGEKLEHRVATKAGDYVYIPADTPHRVMNNSAARCVAVVAHSAGHDQEGIEMRPELDVVG
jgi:uncharacterized RmlC-like cupin family protein